MQRNRQLLLMVKCVPILDSTINIAAKVVDVVAF